jgi:hypothetical protein
MSFAAHPATNRIAFQGRVSRVRKLRPGRYTLILGARNAAGSVPSHALTFTIVR